jgi:hypothetical protein
VLDIATRDERGIEGRNFCARRCRHLAGRDDQQLSAVRHRLACRWAEQSLPLDHPARQRSVLSSSTRGCRTSWIAGCPRTSA